MNALAHAFGWLLQTSWQASVLILLVLVAQGLFLPWLSARGRATLWVLLRVMHWFNPLVWYAFGRVRQDREMACDELVLAQTQGRENQAYGEAILKVLETVTGSAPHADLVGILETKAHIEKRILMIAQYQRTNRWPVLAILVFAALAVLTLTNAQNRSQVNPSEAVAAPSNALASATEKVSLPDKPSGMAESDTNGLVERTYRMNFEDLKAQLMKWSAADSPDPVASYIRDFIMGDLGPLAAPRQSLGSNGTFRLISIAGQTVSQHNYWGESIFARNNTNYLARCLRAMMKDNGRPKAPPMAFFYTVKAEVVFLRASPADLDIFEKHFSGIIRGKSTIPLMGMKVTQELPPGQATTQTPQTEDSLPGKPSGMAETVSGELVL